MPEETGTPVEKPFEKFELITAILLGLSAIGAALAGIQSGQWGGKQLEAFAQANSITTDASRAYSEAVSMMNADYAVIGQAKKEIIEGIAAETELQQLKSYQLASYFLTRQLNDVAYQALKLPKRGGEDEPVAADPSAAPATDTAAETGAETATEEAPAETAAAETEQPAGDGEANTEAEVEAELATPLSEEVLIGILGTELHDDNTYETAIFAEGTKLFEDAEKKFKEGQQANNNGDEFELAGLYYTIALFFAGLGLVFKTNMRWGFAGAGTLVFLLSTIFMLTRTWA